MTDQQQTSATSAGATPATKPLKLSVPTLTAVLKRAGFTPADKSDYLVFRSGFAVQGYGFTGRWAPRDGGTAWVTHHFAGYRGHIPTDAERRGLRNHRQWAYACYAAALLNAGYRLVPDDQLHRGETFTIKLP